MKARALARRMCWALVVASLLAGRICHGRGAASPVTVQLPQALRAAPAQAGFCVDLGCGDGALAAELAAGGVRTVHALESDPQQVGQARQRLEAAGLYGQAVVEQWAEARLPYADNLINLLVVEDAGAVSRAEMLRVLAPGGTLWTRGASGWEETRKPWPHEFDEWSHGRHGPDGNTASRDTAVETPPACAGSRDHRRISADASGTTTT